MGTRTYSTTVCVDVVVLVSLALIEARLLGRSCMLTVITLSLVTVLPGTLKFTIGVLLGGDVGGAVVVASGVTVAGAEGDGLGF